MRQAFAGMLWSKQLFDYDVARWLDGDPTQPAAAGRAARPAATRDWRHFEAFDIMSMPDKWEYPWFAAWDLGVPLRGARPPRPGVRQVPAAADLPGVVPAPERRAARLRVGLRRRQPAGAGLGRARGVRHRRRPRPRLPEQGLRQAARQLHVVGQPPGRRRLEPVRGRLPRPRQHRADRPLAPARSAASSSSPTPPAGWRSTRSPWRPSPSILNRTGAAAGDRPRAQVPRALRRHEPTRMEHLGVWDDTDGLYYDQLVTPDGTDVPVKVRSMVGIIPLLAAVVVDEQVDRPGDRPSASSSPACSTPAGSATSRSSPSAACVRGEPGNRRLLLGVVGVDRLLRLFEQAVRRARVPVAVRAARPVRRTTATTRTCSTSRGITATIDYEPAESTTSMFGGNSNWRGPLWFPLNYLVVSALERYHRFFGDDFTIEYPTGSGTMLHARQDRRRPPRPARLDVPRRARRPATVLRRGRAPPDATRRGRTTSCSTSTSTATTAPGSAPRTRPVGPASSPTSSAAARATACSPSDELPGVLRERAGR